MSKAFESIMAGLTEAVEESQSPKKHLKRRTVTIIPVKRYDANQVKDIRKSVHMSQSSFAAYLGVSEKNNRSVGSWH